jgi:hypothetical protein
VVVERAGEGRAQLFKETRGGRGLDSVIFFTLQ